ncbi:sodium-dependent lysophosphatidylcholine symporter 1-B-like [Corticium candelabrum]|uniref:sodium-dependent lysophosphatidylcholine symporter 1-B-like n=1 Tax=Corticium candelabrum TaxID=121492 RepID=UPI002E26505D|nr:sodium-dependent lysophosphatidylcholine symporter 1-B-like [Corticium candelabrum]
MKSSIEQEKLLTSGSEGRRSTPSKLSTLRKFLFGVGGAASMMAGTVLGFYLQIFLLETAQLSPGYASIVVFVGKLWDAITDPLVGFWSSKTNTRMGRMRPWLLVSSVPMVAAYIAVWFVPPGNQATKTVYYVLVYCSYQTFMSGFHVPYTALTVYLSTDSKERDSATAFRMVSEAMRTLIGAVTQGVCISIIVDKSSECIDYKDEPNAYLSQEKTAYFTSACIIGILMLISALSPFFGVREVKDAAVTHEPLGFFKSLCYTFKQRPFVYLMLMYLCAWLMVSLVQTNLALYVHYVLDMESEFQYGIILLLVVVVLSIPLWQLSILRLGKKASFVIGITCTLPGLFLLLYITKEYKDLLWVTAIISGVGTGSAFLVPWSMLPDAIDEAAARDGSRCSMHSLCFGRSSRVVLHWDCRLWLYKYSANTKQESVCNRGQLLSHLDS